MNDLQVFKNPEFGEVRLSLQNNEPWLCLTDICKVLELSNSRMVKERLNTKGVSIIDTLTPGGIQKLTYINESNLYKVIFQSRKPEAEKFTEWVTSEVLPSIRKHGMYATEELLDNPDLLIAAATKLKEERAARLEAEKKVEVLTPKGEFYDTVAGSKDAIEMAHAAKVLGIKGYGRNNLFEFLRQKKVLDRDNIPYQKYIDAGYFRTLEQKYTSKCEVKINIKTLVYQKGLEFIRKLIAEDKVA